MTSGASTVRRSSRINGSSIGGSDGSHTNGRSHASSSNNNNKGSSASHKSATVSSDLDTDSDSDSSRATALATAMSDSSAVDPTMLEEKAIEGVRQMKRALGNGEAHKGGSDKSTAGLTLSGGLAGVDLVRGTSGSVCADGGDEWKWGRAMNNDWTSAILAFAMMSVVPFIVLLMLHSCKYHQCSIQASRAAGHERGSVYSGTAAAAPHTSLRSTLPLPHPTAHCPIANCAALVCDSMLLAGVGWHWLPSTSVRAWSIYIYWFIFQLVLYRFMPGPIDHGQPTNAGHTLQYRVNGWNAWWFSHACLFVAVFVTQAVPCYGGS